MINWDDIKKLYLENHVINNSNTNNVVSNDDTEYIGYGKRFVLENNVSNLQISKVYGRTTALTGLLKRYSASCTNCGLTETTDYTTVTFSSRSSAKCIWYPHSDNNLNRTKAKDGHIYVMRITYKSTNTSAQLNSNIKFVNDSTSVAGGTTNPITKYYLYRGVEGQSLGVEIYKGTTSITNPSINVYELTLIDLTEILGYTPSIDVMYDGWNNSDYMNTWIKGIVDKCAGTLDIGSFDESTPLIYSRCVNKNNVHDYYPNFNDVCFDPNWDCIQIFMDGRENYRRFIQIDNYGNETRADYSGDINLFENSETYPLTVGHKYYSVIYDSETFPDGEFDLWSYSINGSTDTGGGCIFTATDSCIMNINLPINPNGYVYSGYFNIIDLTELYGSGKEPTTIDDIKITSLYDSLCDNERNTETTININSDISYSNLDLNLHLDGTITDDGNLYGDYIDCINKKLVDDTDIINMSSLTWQLQSVGYYKCTIPQGMKRNGYCFSSKYKYDDNATTYNELSYFKMICIDNTIYAFDPNRTSLSGFREGLGDCKLIYQKTTPTETTLTNEQLNELINTYPVNGFNAIDIQNINNDGDITSVCGVEYKNGSSIVTDGQIVKIQCGSRIIWERG